MQSESNTRGGGEGYPVELAEKAREGGRERERERESLSSLEYKTYGLSLP